MLEGFLLLSDERCAARAFSNHRHADLPGHEQSVFAVRAAGHAAKFAAAVPDRVDFAAVACHR